MNLDAYIRVSRVNGRKGDSFISPEVQREAIVAWAKANGHEIPKDGWHKEMNRSGGKGKKRPEFEKVLQRVECGQSQGVIVWKLTRFGRSVIEGAMRLQKIEEAGGVVESATEGTQTKLIRHMYLAIAEDELDRLTDSWANAQRRAVERGLWLGPDPFGYRKTVKGTKKNGNPEFGPLEPNPDDGPIVSEAFKIAAGEGLRAAMRYLEKAAPDRRWRTDEARKVLRSRVYLGETFHGQVVNKKAHTPLTTPDRFEAVQARPDMSSRPRRSNSSYPLSGIAACGSCGNPMIGGGHAGSDPQRRYRCKTQCGKGVSIQADKLDAYVRDRIGVALAARSNRIRQESGALDEVQEALVVADSDLTRWQNDDRAREMLGDQRFYAGLEERIAKVKEKQERYQREAGRVHRSEVIPALTGLGDPGQFERAVNAMLRTVRIQRGRGSVAERTEIVWTDESLNAETTENARSPFETTASKQTIDNGMKALGEGVRPAIPGCRGRGYLRVRLVEG